MRTAEDQAKELEGGLTPEEKSLAFAMVESWGWPRGSMPPPYVWVDAFRRVKVAPENWAPDFYRPIAAADGE